MIKSSGPGEYGHERQTGQVGHAGQSAQIGQVGNIINITHAQRQKSKSVIGQHIYNCSSRFGLPSKAV